MKTGKFIRTGNSLHFYIPNTKTKGKVGTWNLVIEDFKSYRNPCDCKPLPEYGVLPLERMCEKHNVETTIWLLGSD